MPHAPVQSRCSLANDNNMLQMLIAIAIATSAIILDKC